VCSFLKVFLASKGGALKILDPGALPLSSLGEKGLRIQNRNLGGAVGVVVLILLMGSCVREQEQEPGGQDPEISHRPGIEGAQLRGANFWATGNEPGWTLEIGPEKTVLVTNYGERRYEIPTPPPEIDMGLKRTTYQGKSGGVEIVIQITGVPCQDSMSGESFGNSVEVRVGPDRVTGCGTTLR
jgi:uncharacterized membrane protein